MIDDIRKDMIEQLSYFIETNPKGYLLYDDVEELFNGVLEKYDSFNNVGYFDACKQLQAYKDKENKVLKCPNCNIDFEKAYQRIDTNDGSTYFKVEVEYCPQCKYINGCDANL